MQSLCKTWEHLGLWREGSSVRGIMQTAQLSSRSGPNAGVQEERKSISSVGLVVWVREMMLLGNWLGKPC